MGRSVTLRLRRNLRCRPKLAENVRAQQIVLGLAPANQPKALDLDQNFSGTASRIVVRSLRHSIRPRNPNRKQVTGLHFPERPIPQKAISRLANRPKDRKSVV